MIPRRARYAVGVLSAAVMACSAAAQVRISEFMAATASTNRDWIELHNAGPAAVELGGWHLSDSPTNLARWTFPATNLAAGGFLVVQASGDTPAGAGLEADFSLSADGEYLALVRPDGVTVEHAYAPYPAQYPDISYGIQTHGTNPTLRAGLAGYLIRRTPGAANTVLPAPHPLYSDDSVAQIDITLSQGDWDWLMQDAPDTSAFRPVGVRFRHGDIDVTVTNAGIQCRGNTSLTKQPRSFNIALNAFVPGQTLLGLERLNLNGDANDPAMERPKLLHALSNALGLPASYANHVALVVHGPNWDRGSWVGGVFFDAIRNNTQPVDDVFLSQRYGTDRGNLYKCNNRQWQATLEYRGATGAAYIGEGTTYDLKHAGGGDTSYDDLAAFVALINQTSTAEFPAAIMRVFDVDAFLQRLAFDVLVGNWDDYWVNANNYHLFLHPGTRRWVYIPYDMDNALGIRWLDADWGTKNVYTWNSLSGGRPATPLATRILNVSEFRKRYTFYLKRMLDTVYAPAVLTPFVLRDRASMTNALPFAADGTTNMKLRERQRYGGDWPYWTYDQFYFSFVEAQQNHNGNVPNDYGVTNFVGVRAASARSQLNVQDMAPILSDFAMTPSLPRTNDAIAVEVRALDDGSSTNVQFRYTFRGGATNVVTMVLQPDGRYTATLPAFGVTGTLRYFVQAVDNASKITYHPYGGSGYAATVEIGSTAFDLAVCELNFHPHPLTAAERAAGVADAEDLEFVEVRNAGGAPLNLAGFRLQDGVTATFPAFTLGAGERAVVVKDAAAFRVRYTNAAIRVIGTYVGSLSNGGEALRLEDAQGGVIQSFRYGDSGAWPGRADGDGSTLERLEAGGDDGDGASWRASSEYGGSPGAAGLGPDNRVVINEVVTHTDPPLTDTIELFNTTAGAIDIGGWCLSDSKGNYGKYAISNGTVLPAGGYAVFREEEHFNASAGADTNDFSLDGAHGDDVYLMEADAQGRLARFADHVEFGAAVTDESFGRWPDGTGRLCPMVARTFGAANSGPRVGPLVIDEILYHPPSGSNQLEFVGVANPTVVSMDVGGWQLDGGVSFTFPPGTLLPPGGGLAVLPFDPGAATNGALLAEFLATYGLSNAVTLAGAFSNALADGGERIRLLRPDAPPFDEPGFTPMVIVDEVAYDDEAPWPPEAAGGGASLERRMPAGWGDDAGSWEAGMPPTPGVAGEALPTCTLTVISAHGNPVPSAGAHAVLVGAVLSNAVPSPSVVGGTRYICGGWITDGDPPQAGPENWMIMTVTNDVTLTWLWRTNFMLAVSAGAGGQVLPAGGWYEAGEVVALQAEAEGDHRFTGWSGDTNAIVTGSASTAAIAVRLDGPVALAAAFEPVQPTYYVAPGGGNVAPYTNWAMAARSLASMADYAPAGATVRVAAAEYRLADTLVLTNGVHLRSEDGAAATILDGGHAVRVLYLTGGGATVEGFTIRGGNSGGASGGGARIEPAGRLIGCIIRDNVTQRSGGGVTLIGGGEMRNCLVLGNAAAAERGGGIYTYTEGTAPRIESCTVAGNHAAEGGGLYLNGSATVLNSIVWGNTAGAGSNLVVSGSGQAIVATASGTPQTGSGNVGASPRFVAAAGGDYRLAADSPCLDAGTNQVWMDAARDLDGRPRVIHGRADMGAYEAILAAWDSDADGLPDWWEWERGGVLEGLSPDADPDGDRMTHDQEYRAGTDPFDAASFLGIRSAMLDAPAGSIVMSWSSVSGRQYRIGFSTNLAQPGAVVFSNLAADPPANSFTGAVRGAGAGFYRIELDER